MRWSAFSALLLLVGCGSAPTCSNTGGPLELRPRETIITMLPGRKARIVIECVPAEEESE